MGLPSVFPTGVTIYDPDRAENGYVLVGSADGPVLIDLNGHEVHQSLALPGSPYRLSPEGEIIETDQAGQTIWRWRPSDHIDELGFSEAARGTLHRLEAEAPLEEGHEDWLGIAGLDVLGPNKWYDAGDDRFHPDNLVLSARSANIVAIISRGTGDIVWRLGPDFARNPRTEKLGWIVAPGDVHLIPRGTPGEGHLLLLDGGGTGGYGAPRGSVTNGIGVERRDYSRILEIDPISLAVVWQYTPDEAGHVQPLDSYKFFSASGGSVQRLPNGNTLIADSDTGRVFQVTPGHETVWEYVSPTAQKNPVSRATLVPYERLPQLPRPTRTAVIPPNVTDFRVPGSPNGAGAGKITVVDGVDPHRLRAVRDPHGVINSADETPHDFCVVPIAPAGVPEPAAQANSK